LTKAKKKALFDVWINSKIYEMQKEQIRQLKQKEAKYIKFIKFFKSTALKLFLESEFDPEYLKKANKDGFDVDIDNPLKYLKE
jgi:hypothetical protein